MESTMALDAGHLLHFFTPGSIAVLGASSREGSIGWRVVSYLQSNGYQGIIYPINPKQDKILGLKVYKNILDVNESVDLAFIALAAENTIEALRQCEQSRVKFIILISAGFAETGEEGKKLQQYVTDFAKRTGIRVLGPNCQGAINFVDQVAMSFSSALEYGFIPGPSVSSLRAVLPDTEFITSPRRGEWAWHIWRPQGTKPTSVTWTSLNIC